jgi:hypothetical protein
MFSACMIGGTLYGTGRKFEHLTAYQRVTAMKVSKIDDRDQPGFLANPRLT